MVTAALLLLAAGAWAQNTATTGSIAGTVTGPNGAVSGAKITIINQATELATNVSTSTNGTYNSGPLHPDEYTVKVDAEGFLIVQLHLSVQASTTTEGDVHLRPSVGVNREQAGIQAIITSQQIEQLPIGRNFLDLAQLTPGVQVEDGKILAPSKNGFSAVSIGGGTGRSVRIEADGIDLSDENAGTTTRNIPSNSIQEFRVSQSGLNVSSGPTSTGTVNVVTKSGSDALHGHAFGLFGDKRIGGANSPGGQDLPLQRDIFGGSLGGPLLKKGLFFFLAGEHFKQDLSAPAVFSDPFVGLSGGYHAPYRESELDGRLDYQFKNSARFFYKFTYDNDSVVNSFGTNNYQPFKNRNNTPAHTLGFDFSTGSYTHSIRFGYSKFVNSISDAVAGTSIYDPAPAISLTFQGGSGFGSGVNFLAPQKTIQGNKEFKYDGSRVLGTHTFRYGFSVNLIQDYVFADFFGSAPQVTADTGSASTAYVNRTCGSDITCLGNPLNYPVDSITIGNPFGCFSEKSAFGFPCGGLADHRIQLYAGDNWKARPNLTVTYGLRYVRDTGRANSDLAPTPCSATTLFSCTGNLLDQFGSTPGLSDRIRQPNENFGPQLGFAWAPAGGRTVIRGGAGLYYDTSVFSNILFDRVARLANGEFNGQAPDPCPTGVLVMPDGSRVTSVDGLDIGSQICGQAVGATQAAIGDLQKEYQATALALGASAPNPFFVGQMLDTFGTLAPHYQTPRSVQMNIGLQRELRRGTVFSLDYVRSIGTHYLLGSDTNHVGDSRYMNLNAALNAINATVSQAGCGPVTSAGANSQSAIDCYIAATPGASIADFARNGLDSGGQYLGGVPAEVVGLTPDTGAAFPGINPLVGRNVMFFSAGNSRYSAVQVSLRSQLIDPAREIKTLDLQIAYAHARYDSNVPGGSSLADSSVLPVAASFLHPTIPWGPSSADRTHQISFSALMHLARIGRLALIGHFDSPLAQTLFLPASGGAAGEIFRTDLNGDGQFGGNSLTGNAIYGDILPGTNIGSFGRSITAGNLETAIKTYNANYANKLTPAGAALISNDLFRGYQVAALGGLTPMLQPPPANSVGLAWLRSLDVTYTFPFKIGERVTIVPSVSAFNVLNFSNFDALNNTMAGVLDGAAGAANGTTAANRAGTRVGVGSGVFALGAPRQLEFGLKISF